MDTEKEIWHILKQVENGLSAKRGHEMLCELLEIKASPSFIKYLKDQRPTKREHFNRCNLVEYWDFADWAELVEWDDEWQEYGYKQ